MSKKNFIAGGLSFLGLLWICFDHWPSRTLSDLEFEKQVTHSLAEHCEILKIDSGFYPGFQKGRDGLFSIDEIALPNSNMSTALNAMPPALVARLINLSNSSKGIFLAFDGDGDGWVAFEGLKLRCNWARIKKLQGEYIVNLYYFSDKQK